jgi:predicted MFS family arabinose efflux permease
VIFLLATTCGFMAASIYYAQPLIAPISESLKLSPEVSGLIVTVSQVGYGASLLLIAPLGDIIENKKLIIIALIINALALAGTSVAVQPLQLFIAMLLIGLSAVASQIVVPFAAHFASEKDQGKIVGKVVSGLMLGIMLSRPVASFLTNLWSWRLVFGISAAAILVLVVFFALFVPKRNPKSEVEYGALIKSMGTLLLTTPLLRRRALYHACLFGVFSLFWTTVPLLLAMPPFKLSQNGIALFSFAGVAGAIAAPIAGKIADNGFGRLATRIAILIVAGAFILMYFSTQKNIENITLLTIAAIIMDFGVSMNLVIGQRALFSLNAQYRSRFNGLYIAIFFAGGAIGSGVGTWIYAQFGWAYTLYTGFVIAIAALIYAMTEKTTQDIN